MRLSRLQFAAVVVAVAVVAAAAPVAAQSVVNFARNAGHVDGIRAVHAKASVTHRSGRLVATDKNGYLPDGIVRKVPLAADARRLAGRGPGAFVQQCGAGAVLGQAVVAADVGPAYEDVPGFGTFNGGPPIRSTGTTCRTFAAQAEHVAPGVYRVTLVGVGESDAACSGTLPSSDAAVLVTVRSDAGTPLVATYRPVCDASLSNRLVDEVRISDPAGTPADATFTIELVNVGGVPAP